MNDLSQDLRQLSFSVDEAQCPADVTFLEMSHSWPTNLPRNSGSRERQTSSGYSGDSRRYRRLRGSQDYHRALSDRFFPAVLVVLLLPHSGQLSQMGQLPNAAAWPSVPSPRRVRGAISSPLTQLLGTHAAVLASETMLEDTPFTPGRASAHSQGEPSMPQTVCTDASVLFSSAQATNVPVHPRQMTLDVQGVANVRTITKISKSTQCLYQDEHGQCGALSFYGKHRKLALWCREHRKSGDIDVRVRAKRCVREGCNRFAIYGSGTPLSPKLAMLLKRTDSTVTPHTHSNSAEALVPSTICASAPPARTGSTAAGVHKLGARPANLQAGGRWPKSLRGKGAAATSPSGVHPDRGSGPSAVAQRGVLFCARHRRKSDYDKKNKRCQHPDGCLCPAKYGLREQVCMYVRVRVCVGGRGVACV